MNLAKYQGMSAGDVKSAVMMRGCGAGVLRDVAGVPAEALDGKHHPCPNCGGKDRFRVVDVRAGDVFCNHGCWGGRKRADVLTVVQVMRGVKFWEAVKNVAEYAAASEMEKEAHRPIRFPSSKKSDSGTLGRDMKKAVPAKKALRVTHYDYTDGGGKLYLRVTRWDYADGTKVILPSYWDAQRERYMPGIAGRERVPFNAPAVKKASTIFFVEGEKCAVALQAYLTPEVLAEMKLLPSEVAVTCIIGGVNGWKQELAAWFRGKTVFILPDNDEPGYRFAWRVKQEMETAGDKQDVTSTVTVFRWSSGTPVKWDIADALANHSSRKGGADEYTR